jgi:hypothetical protein
MTVEQRILKCLHEITDIVPENDQPLQNYGLDSLDIMSFMHNVELEFDVKNVFNVKLVGIKNVSLDHIKLELEKTLI